MVACGLAMAAVASLGAVLAWRKRRLPDERWYLKTLVASSPLGLVALEAGWTVTEVGRQPWIVRGVMRTADAVTPMPNLVVPFATFTLLYLMLGAIVVVLLKRQVFASTRPMRPPTQAGKP
jgi:cytochrome d ubiquinol oxidase subunit I